MVNVDPLNFIEYLELKESKIDITKIELWKEEIKEEFKNYLLRPFPEIINLKELSLVKSYIKDNVIEKVLKIDLSKRFRNINEDLLTTLIDIFYNRPGTYINYDDIAKDLKISKKTLIQHIYYLEFAYVIRKIKNFRVSTRATSRKLQRAYPYHWALGFGWTGKIDFETVVASLLKARYYWRKNGKEIDFLLVNNKIVPIEAKEGSQIDKNELKSLIYFTKRFNLREGIIVYDGEEEKVKIDNIVFKKIPLWKLFLTNLNHKHTTTHGI